MNTATENLRSQIRNRLTATRNDDSVAGIIRRQISGNALMYAGARDYVAGPLSFIFRTNIDKDGFMGARPGRFHVTVTLDQGSDTYSVRLTKTRGVKVSTIREIDGVYADMLTEMIEAISRGEWN